MNEPITATVKAWFTGSGSGPDDLKREPVKVMSCLGFSNSDMTQHGWSHMGNAEITVTPMKVDDMVAAKVESLLAEKARTLATAQMNANLIDKKVQSLLAITNEVKA